MTTPLDIITLSLKSAGVNGVGQAPSAEDTADVFTTLNNMLGQWARKRWLVYHLIDLSKTATGALSYSIGSGGDFDTPRTDKIESAFVRLLNGQTNPVDFQLGIIESREDYNRISLKNLNSFPCYVFLDSGYPTGQVYVWPVPSSQYQIHLTVKAPLSAFATLTQDVDLPPEYFEAILSNLAVRIAPLYQLPVHPVTARLAATSLATIRNANSQLPVLQMPSDLVRGRDRGPANASQDVIFSIGRSVLS